MGNPRRAVAGLAITILTAMSASAAELPPPIQIDRLLVQAERETREGNHWSAVYTLERVLGLYQENDMDIPPAFWFRQATTLGSAGRHERAVAAATRYLQEAGQDGEHYRLALELLDGSEAALREARARQDRARAAAERARQEAEVRLQDVLAASPEMVVVPGRAFRMGCLSGKRCWRNEPVRRLRVASFAISKHEVTFAQWDACTRFGGCRKLEDRIMRGGKWREGWGRGRQPVIYVSWHDAQSYVTWLSRETGEAYRLPTEAEWEYAARAATETQYWWGDRADRNRANCDGCRSEWSGRRPAPVGSFEANPFGLHDMLGNVWEWVEDCASFGYERAPTDGSAWVVDDCLGSRTEERVIRGGSWDTSRGSIRAETRWGRAPGYKLDNVGFRVAKTLPPQTASVDVR